MPNDFDIHDTVGAWVPHGRFIVPPTARGPLTGMRFAAKDVFDVAGHPTGAGNPTWLQTHPVPAEHSAVVAQLLDAGATLVGKVVTDELAYSLHGDNVHYGTPVNSMAPECVPGGSSSGSAAAAGAGLVDFALGTDTGGSTRVPASYSGLWGLRTTHGLVSRRGLVPLHPSFDTVTWLARDAATFERVGAVLLPDNPCSPTRVLVPDDAWALADPVFREGLEAVRDGLASELNAPITAQAWGEQLPLDRWRQTYATAGAHEGWQAHGEWITAHRPAFGAPIAARWKAASEVSAEAAGAARDLGAQIRTDVLERLGSNGIAVLPSAASLAPRRDADSAAVDAIRLRTMTITCIAGLSGAPQVSMPFRTSGGAVLGVSLLGPAGSDLALIRLARKIHARIS